MTNDSPVVPRFEIKADPIETTRRVRVHVASEAEAPIVPGRSGRTGKAVEVLVTWTWNAEEQEWRRVAYGSVKLLVADVKKDGTLGVLYEVRAWRLGDSYWTPEIDAMIEAGRPPVTVTYEP